MTVLRHAGIVAADLERSLGFYRDLLGFRVVREMEESGPYLEALLGMPGARVRTVKLAGTEGGAQVELLAFAAPADRGGGGALNRPGPTHVAVTVRGIDDLYRRMRAAGVAFVSAPLGSPDGRVRVAFCRDPDGTFVELVEERE